MEMEGERERQSEERGVTWKWRWRWKGRGMWKRGTVERQNRDGSSGHYQGMGRGSTPHATNRGRPSKRSIVDPRGWIDM
jgi:hypothetical protein